MSKWGLRLSGAFRWLVNWVAGQARQGLFISGVLMFLLMVYVAVSGFINQSDNTARFQEIVTHQKQILATQDKIEAYFRMRIKQVAQEEANEETIIASQEKCRQANVKELLALDALIALSNQHDALMRECVSDLHLKATPK